MNIYQGYQNHNLSRPSVVVIDVLRAGTTLFHLFECNIENCYLVGNVADAKKYAKTFDALLVGESGGYKIEGFDFGNSPSQVLNQKAYFQGRNVVLLTTNGVRAVVNNLAANMYLVGFVNAFSLAKALQKTGVPKENIALIASHPTSDDDLACAEYIRDVILAKTLSTDRIKKRINESISAQKFHNDPYFPIEDLELAKIEQRKVDYIIKIKENTTGLLACSKEYISI